MHGEGVTKVSMKAWKRAVLTGVGLVLGTVVSALAEVEVTDRVQIKETVTDGFVHPGIGLTKGMLEGARAQLLTKREPWYSGFQKMAAHGASAKTVEIINQDREDPTRPIDVAFNNRDIMKRLEYDSEKAWRQALMYFFTGDMAHRANAMTIIRLWSQLDPDTFETFHSSHIHTPYPVKDLVMTAELMRYTDCPDETWAWTEQDQAKLRDNLIIPSINTYMYQNGWFMNQNGYPLAGAMACFIFLNDRKGYEERVEWFTVNKDAPNKGYSSSIKHLFRRVETDALTRKSVEEPFVQLMEMGRDQAHASGDMEIACNTARMMNAQGTKVDPVRGTISTAADAVGPYEFLDDRILAGADYFSRFMLGYDTPWIPSPSSIDSNGDIQQIYTRLADNYRGRIRDLNYWDLFYYYTYKKGVNVAEVAPFYDEAFRKRVVSSDFEWLFIPPEAEGEAARIPQTAQEPDEVEIVERSTGFGNASVLEEDNNTFLRVTPSPEGARIALLSMKTPSKTVGMKIRTTGVVTLEMEGFGEPWLLPNTQGQWRMVTYTMPDHEYVEDLIFLHARGTPETTLDLDQFWRKADEQLKTPVFATGNAPRRFHAYAGAPVKLDFSAAGGGDPIICSSLDKPAGSELDAETGAFAWTPGETGETSFVVEAFDGTTVVSRRVLIAVTEDRQAALAAIKAVYNSDTTYVKRSVDRCVDVYRTVAGMANEAGDDEFWEGLVLLQQAFHDLEILTPLLPDGSMNYPKILASSDIGDNVGLLIDSNDDTFPDAALVEDDMDYMFDFGPDFQVSFTEFAMEGRINFEDRMEGTVFYGSNDQEEWTELTRPTEPAPELLKVGVHKNRQEERFRYLRIKRHGRRFFEPSELRIYGERHDAE